LCAEIAGAVREASGSRKGTLVAAMALHLARDGYATNIRFEVVGGSPLAAVRAAFVGAVADANQNAQKPAGGERADSQVAPLARFTNASSKRTGALVKRTRPCLGCGAVFEVNFRHGDTHRFC
jgi:hypothetical protein